MPNGGSAGTFLLSTPSLGIEASPSLQGSMWAITAVVWIAYIAHIQSLWVVIRSRVLPRLLSQLRFFDFNHASYGQLAKGYQKISWTVVFRSALSNNANTRLNNLRCCALLMILCALDPMPRLQRWEAPRELWAALFVWQLPVDVTDTSAININSGGRFVIQKFFWPSGHERLLFDRFSEISACHSLGGQHF